MSSYDIFLFDADGTLYDYDKSEADALKAVFNFCGFNYSENVRKKYREINSTVWQSYEKGDISKTALQTLRFDKLFKDIGVDFDSNLFNEKYLYELGKGTHLIDGAEEICKEIYSFNKKIYIVTNGILATQKSRMENSLIKQYISGAFVSEHIGFQKPHISYFDYVFEHIPKVSKDRILIIGDSLSADIAGGNNAGIDSCWLNLSKTTNQTNIAPTFEISSLYELRQFLK
ncbi:MAG: noncanonical pyrimidine nucleotidase, YjjG family [Clostridiales bacterium]|nr:noncanonical pyrimidine nucleotidase, YjjG family [Clostridiales bacterium]